MTNMPDRASAMELAKALVADRLAACVNVLAGAESVYRWRGKVETATEVPVLIKTAERRLADLEAAILARHPYELPEIITVPLVAGLAGYLDWVLTEVTAEP
jgi:periplasmic divalent cation tolerance protein